MINQNKYLIMSYTMTVRLEAYVPGAVAVVLDETARIAGVSGKVVFIPDWQLKEQDHPATAPQPD